MRVRFNDFSRTVVITDEPSSSSFGGAPSFDLARLRRLLAEQSGSAAALRRLLHARGEPMPALPDDELAERVIRLLDAGVLGLELEPWQPRVSTPGDAPGPISPSELEPELDLEHWLEVMLVGEDGEGIGGARCRIELPDGRCFTQTTDRFGLIRIDGITDASECTIDFPDLDHRAWEPI